MVKRKNKTTFVFRSMLAVISIVGFLTIIGNTWFDFALMGNLFVGIILLALGFGMAMEGQIRKWKTFPKNGLSGAEFSHIVTGIVGFLAIVAGSLYIVGVDTPLIESYKNIVSTIAVIFIAIETWLVK